MRLKLPTSIWPLSWQLNGIPPTALLWAGYVVPFHLHSYVHQFFASGVLVHQPAMSLVICQLTWSLPRPSCQPETFKFSLHFYFYFFYSYIFFSFHALLLLYCIVLTVSVNNYFLFPKKKFRKGAKHVTYLTWNKVAVVMMTMQRMQNVLLKCLFMFLCLCIHNLLCPELATAINTD